MTATYEIRLTLDDLERLARPSGLPAGATLTGGRAVYGGDQREPAFEGVVLVWKAEATPGSAAPAGPIAEATSAPRR